MRSSTKRKLAICSNPLKSFVTGPDHTVIGWDKGQGVQRVVSRSKYLHDLASTGLVDRVGTCLVSTSTYTVLLVSDGVVNP